MEYKGAVAFAENKTKKRGVFASDFFTNRRYTLLKQLPCQILVFYSYFKVL